MALTKEQIIKDTTEKLEKSRAIVSENTELHIQKRKSINSLEDKKLLLNTEIEEIERSIRSENHQLVKLTTLVNGESREVRSLEATLKETTRELDIDNSITEFPDFYVALIDQLRLVQSEFEKFNLELKNPEVFVKEVEATIKGSSFDRYTVYLREICGAYTAMVREIAAKKVDGVKLVPKDFTGLSKLLDNFLRVDIVEARWS